MITISMNNSEHEAQSSLGMAFSQEVMQEPTALETFRTQLQEDFKAIGEIDWIKK